MIGSPLLVDIGNSRIHVGLSEHGRLRRADLHHERRAELDQVLAALLGSSQVPVAAVTSVHDAALTEVVASLDRLGCQNVQVFRRYQELPLSMAVRTPETVGMDRLMNVLGARSLAAGPHVVLDFGTALTVSVLDQDDRFLGGAIAPGWRLMASALHQGTALLPALSELADVPFVGKDTRAAIASGLRHGLVGAARELIRGTLAEARLAGPTVWATGGDAAQFVPSLPEITRVDADLSLRGIGFAFERRRGDGSLCRAGEESGSTDERPR